MTGDRTGLFSTLTGILYGWGMDITKASAFSNQAGVIVDSFYFKDRFRTLELNPSERERFKKSVIDILSGYSSLDRLLEPRLRADTKPPKLKDRDPLALRSTSARPPARCSKSLPRIVLGCCTPSAPPSPRRIAALK